MDANGRSAGAEGVTTVDVAALYAALEPLDALAGSAVGEGFGNHVAAALLLQAVIADGAGRVERLLDVAFFQHLAAAIGVVAPDPGEAVRLQFQLNRERIGLRLAETTLR